MKVLIDKFTKAVIDISETAEMVENGIKADRCIYAQKDLIDVVDVADVTGVEIQKSRLDEATGTFVANPDYVEPVVVQDQRITDLEAQVAELQAQIQALLNK